MVLRASREMIETGELDAADEIIHREFVNHEAHPQHRRGVEGYKQTVQWLRETFGEPRFDVEDVVAGGDKVVLRARFRGRHTGELMGRPGTGKEFDVQHIHIFRLADGKVIEHWANRDDIGMLQQLGLLPGGS